MPRAKRLGDSDQPDVTREVIAGELLQQPDVVSVNALACCPRWPSDRHASKVAQSSTPRRSFASRRPADTSPQPYLRLKRQRGSPGARQGRGG
jgi:hypothetical protein